MIKYQLKCPLDHEFEGWFRNSAEYDEQSEQGLLACPSCGSEDVAKAIMAPAIPKKSNARTQPALSPQSSGTDNQSRKEGPLTTRNPERLEAIRKDVIAAAERARKYVENNFDYVGEKFPEEARRIHYGEVEERAIFGEATGSEVKELLDEGVGIAPLPTTRKTEVIKKDDKKKLN